MDGAKEDAADEDPEHDGQPAESSSLDGTGDRACTCNGAELVCKHGPAIGGEHSRGRPHGRLGGLGFGVDAPLVGQPASVERVSAQQTHGCNQNDDQRIHFLNLFPFFQAAMRKRQRVRDTAAALQNHRRNGGAGGRKKPPSPKRWNAGNIHPSKTKACYSASALRSPRYHFVCCFAKTAAFVNVQPPTQQRERYAAL